MKRLAPETFFGRILSAILLVAILAIALLWFWFDLRFYQSLDTEAENRLINMARHLGSRIEADKAENSPDNAEVLKLLWQFEENGGWLQNLYWLDVSADKPRFIASFSAQNPLEVSILPPGPEEIEDLVFANINELEKGRPVFPDPFAPAASRRFKIVLFPLLDQFNMLETVIGIEADLEYLHVYASLREFLLEILLGGFLLSCLVALIVAGNFSKKIAFLLQELKKIENGHIPDAADLRIRELNLIHQGLLNMAEEISKKDKHLKQVFDRKLEELAFTGGSIAHEVRNPLSAIELHFALLKRKLQAPVASAPEITEVEEQLQHLRRLIESFLGYSRRVRPQLQEIELTPFFTAKISSLATVYPNLKVALRIDTDARINFDQTMLQQICDNLCSNAAASAEHIINMHISFVREESAWKLVFKNDGPPIPDDLLPRLFTPFAGARPNGNGMGLALTRKLVEAHGGEICCENCENGVIFVIEVPFS